MPTNESFATFLRSFEERRQEFLTRLNVFPIILSRNDQRNKIDAAQKLRASLQSLQAMLSRSDRPVWLQQLEGLLDGILGSVDGQDPIDTASQHLLDIVPQARAQAWNFREAKQEAGVDFDAIYGDAFEASKLPGLFDRLVQRLEKIVGSGHVDSVKAIQALEKLIATLRRSKTGSFTSKAQAYLFAKTFVRHAVWNSLEAIPILGPLAKSVRDTIDEMKPSFDEVNSSVKLQIESKTAMEMPMLEVAPTTQLSLPGPTVTGT